MSRVQLLFTKKMNMGSWIIPTLIALATVIGLDAAGLDALFIAAEDL